MSEITKYEAQKKKLDGLCEEHDLVYRLRKNQYPITLTIRPIQGTAEQLSLLEKAEGEDYISPNASMKWIFEDGELTSKVEGGTFTISKVLRTKIENIFLKMISFWQQYFFQYLITAGIVTERNMPVIDEMDADDSGDEDIDDEEAEDLSDGEDPDEDLITAATLLVRQENKATVSLLQRRLKLGYSKAARLIDMLEEAGVVGPYRGSEPREVLPADVPEEG